MTDDARRLKHLEVTPEWIVDMLKDGNEIRVDVTDGLPEDAEFRRLEYHFDYDVYWVIVWSSSFDPVPEGASIPGTTVEFTDVIDEESERLSDTEFRALLDLAMVSDPWPLPGEHKSVVETLLVRESQARDYGSWIEAYHEVSPGVEDYTEGGDE